MPTIRRLSGLILVAALVLALAAPASAQKTKLTYAGWLGLYGAYKDAVQYMKDEFERKNPSVDFVRNDVPFDQALNQATISFQGKNSADVIHSVAGWLPSLVEIGAVMPLNDVFPAGFWAKIPKGLLDSVTIDGKIMAVPWVPGPILMFYNRNLMKQAGLNPDQPPQTWPELAQAIRAISKLPPVGGAKVWGFAMRTARNPNSAHWMIPIIYGHGGDVVDAAGNVKINTPEARAAYKWVQDLVKEGCVPEGLTIDETRNTMAAGRAGFIFEGPWGSGLFSNLSSGKTITGAGADVWLTPMPKDPNGNRRTIGNPHLIAISSLTQHKKEAAAFIEFVLSDPVFTKMYFESSKQLSTANLEILRSGPMGADPYTQVFVQAMGQSNDVPIKSSKFTAIMNEIVPSLQAIIGGANIETELAGADRRVQRVLSR